jgi:hypothetical protein
MEWAGQVTALAKLPRAVAGDPEVEKALRTLARKIGRESAG